MQEFQNLLTFALAKAPPEANKALEKNLERVRGTLKVSVLVLTFDSFCFNTSELVSGALTGILHYKDLGSVLQLQQLVTERKFSGVVV